MKYIVLFGILVSLFSCSSKHEEKINLKKTLYGPWIEKDYYSYYLKTHSPDTLKEFSFPILGIYYFPSDKYMYPPLYSDKVLQLVYPNGNRVNSFNVTFDSLKSEIRFKENIEDNHKTITDFYIDFNINDGDTVLILKFYSGQKEITKEYVKLEFKYKFSAGYMNYKKFLWYLTISGRYINISNHEQKRDTLVFSNCLVKGINGFTDYSFNNKTLNLTSTSLSKTFYWIKRNDTLFLNSPDDSIVLKQIADY